MSNKDIEDITAEEFIAFEDVRRYGRWNMFDPMAKASTGLDDDTYLGVIHHYTELKEKYSDKIKDRWNKRVKERIT